MFLARYLYVRPGNVNMNAVNYTCDEGCTRKPLASQKSVYWRAYLEYALLVLAGRWATAHCSIVLSSAPAPTVTSREEATRATHSTDKTYRVVLVFTVDYRLPETGQPQMLGHYASVYLSPLHSHTIVPGISRRALLAARVVHHAGWLSSVGPVIYSTLPDCSLGVITSATFFTNYTLFAWTSITSHQLFPSHCGRIPAQ